MARRFAGSGPVRKHQSADRDQRTGAGAPTERGRPGCLILILAKLSCQDETGENPLTPGVRGVTCAAMALRWSSRALVLMLSLFAPACGERIKAERVALTGVDALWGDSAFCARAGGRLACWAPDLTPDAPPVFVEGIAGVKQVAMLSQEGCVLHDRGVSCFHAGQAGSRPLDLPSPSQVVASTGYQGLLCVAHAGGVTCWDHAPDQKDVAQSSPVAALGSPQRLLAGDGHLCSINGSAMHCFLVGPRFGFDARLELSGLTDPRAVLTEPVGGDIWVIDGTQLLHGQFGGTLRITGDVFAAKDPLAVSAEVVPFQAAAPVLQPVAELGAVRAAVLHSIYPVVLDERGLAEYNLGVVRWPVASGIPTALFGDQGDDVYVIAAGTLHRLRNRVDVEVRNVTRPTQLAVGLSWGCALEETGTVACFRTR
jgi:hypothetical protein